MNITVYSFCCQIGGDGVENKSVVCGSALHPFDVAPKILKRESRELQLPRGNEDRLIDAIRPMGGHAIHDSVGAR